MKNISGQYQDLLEGKMTQAQFLRNARMMFPNFVTQHNSFNDSVRILKQKGMLNEGDAVKGTPDKEPTYESPTPDVKTKYKKVEQSPEVAEQDGIYPATTLTDIPKVKANKKVKNESDGLEPIKDNDTKNEMKKVKVVKEGIHDRDITSASHTNVKTPPKGVGDYDPKARAASLARLKNMGPKTNEKLKESRISPDNRVPYLDNVLRHVWNMGTGKNKIDYTSLAQSIIEDLFDDNLKESVLENLVTKILKEELAKKSAK